MLFRAFASTIAIKKIIFLHHIRIFMYKRIAGLGFLISFSLHAMEQILPPSISVDEHDAIMYPLDPENSERLEKAKARVQQDNADEEGLKGLLALATDPEKPSVSAIRTLTSIALRNEFYEEGLSWALRGAAYNDLLSKFSAASLLLNPELVPSIAQTHDPLSIEGMGRQLLIDASQIRQFSDSSFFYLPGVQQYIAQLNGQPDRLQQAVCKMLKQNKRPQEHQTQSVVQAIDSYFYRLKMEKGIKKSVFKRTINAVIQILENRGFSRAKKDLIQTKSDQALELGIKLLQIAESAKIISEENKNVQILKEAGNSFLTHLILQENAHAAWRMVEYNLESHSLHEYLKGAIGATFADIEKLKPKDHHSQSDSFNVTWDSDSDTAPLVATMLPILEKLMHHLPLTIDVHNELAALYLNGIPYVLNPNLDKAILHLGKAHNVNQLASIGKMLLQQDARIYSTDASLCFSAAKILHEQLQKDLPEAVYNYFMHAVKMSDIEELKAIVEYGLEHQDICNVARQAMSAYLSAVSKENRSDDKEISFIHSVKDRMVEWARGKNDPTLGALIIHAHAVMFLHDLVHRFKRKDLLDENCLKELDKWIDWVALAGNDEAIELVGPRIKNPVPADISLAINVWHRQWEVAESPAKKQEASAYTRKISELFFSSKEPGALEVSARSHYLMAHVLIDTAPEVALKHIIEAEELIAKPGDHAQDHAQESIFVAAAKLFSVLEEKANEGEAWAQYGLAAVLFNQAQQKTVSLVEDPQRILTEFKRIIDLLEKAGPVKKLFGDTAKKIVTVAQVEYEASLQLAFDSAAQKFRTDKDEFSSQEALSLLKSSAGKGYPEAQFTLAAALLDGKLDKGQSALELGIEFLSKASLAGEEEAVECLKVIDTQGYHYHPNCGGAITTQMREQIQEVLSKIPEPTSNVKNDNSQTNQPEPKKDSIQQALECHTKTKNYSRAFELLREEAIRRSDPRAYAYLGLMYRDGLLVERSDELARDYFIKALINCKNMKDGSYREAVNLANESLADSKNFQIRMARLKTTLVMANENPEAQDYEKIFNWIREIEALAYNSPSAQDRNYFFESGTAAALIAFLKTKSNPRWWFGAVGIFVDRIAQLGFPDYKKNPSAMDTLLLPFCNMAQMLEERIRYARWVQHFKTMSEEADDVIKKLNAITEKKIAQEPFKRLSGLLQIVTSLDKVYPQVRINAGMKDLQTAYNNGDADAGCVLGALYLEGNKLHPAISKNLKMGKSILLDLIKKGNTRSALTMARHLSSEKQSAESYTYASDILKKNPENVDAAVLMVQACLDDPKLLKMLEEEENIAQVLALATNNEKIKKIIPFYEVYFAIRGKMEATSDHSILGSLLQACETAVGIQEVSNSLVHIFRATDFEKKFEKWIQERGTSDKNLDQKKDFIAKTYTAAAWIAFLKAQYAFKENKPTLALDCYKKCLNCCDMALALKTNDLSAYCLKAWIYFQEHFADRAVGWDGLKSVLTRIGVIMGLKQLTLDNIPALNALINKLLLVHGQGTYFVGVNGIELIPNPDPIGAVVDPNIEFIKKFKEKHSSASNLKVIKIEV